MASDTRKMDTADAVIAHLGSLAKPDGRAGMARFGIDTELALGLSMPVLRATARQLGRNQTMAEEPWQSGLHEARILAALVAEPAACDNALLES